MKKIILLFLFTSNIVFGQLNLTGDAYYKLDIIGYQDRDSGGCGDIDGLRYIKATRVDGSSFMIWSGRKLYEEVNHSITYTKKDPVVNLEFYKIVRWETWIGTCEGGPNHNYDNININNTCFSVFQGNAGSALKNLTVTSRPYVNLNAPSLMYFGDTETLNITLPDDIDKRYFVWKYKVGTGQEQFIPNQFNNSNILNIKGSDFLTDADFGKTVSIWVEMNCDAGAELAKGYARRTAYYQYIDCLKNCFISPEVKKCEKKCLDKPILERFSCESACFQNCSNNCISQYSNTLLSIDSNPPNLQTYQSKTSNVISFTYLKSAPKITNFQVSSVNCNYTNDGEIKINFDRNTIANETLTILLKNTSKLGTDQVSYNVTLDENNSCVINSLEEGNYELVVSGGYDNKALYSPTLKDPLKFLVTKPAPVNFSLSKVDVWCNGGNDGNITITASGGNELKENESIRYYYSLNNSNWLPFSAETTHTIYNLIPGTYTIKVRDYKECYAKTPQGDDKALIQNIMQPNAPVILSYNQVLQPTFYGGTNGRLVAKISGGTRFADNSYSYECKNSSGVLQTASTYYDMATQSYYITLEGIPSDTYTITITDKNYSSATHKNGCTVINASQYLGQPDPIVVTLELVKEISCNVSNQFGNEVDMNPYDNQRDESQDGVIKATVTGGVVFGTSENGGLPYKFFWKKQQPNGSWIDWNDFDATAESLSHGNYSLNVEDKNGIRLGIYVNNSITQETPKTYFISQPNKLELSFVKGDISCNTGNDGWITAVPTGGTPPYTYQWNNGGVTNRINNLSANNYFVKITDNKGCTVQGNIIIAQPNGVAISGTITTPSCHNSNNGSIQVVIIGGTSPYTYAWSNNAITKDITNLTAGVYTLKVVDANGCVYFKDFELENPAPVLVNLGDDRTLCNGQSLDFDITINDPLAQYSWNSVNGFTSNSPKVSLTKADTYTAKIITAKGCAAQDDVVIKTNNISISSNFFLTSQAYKDEEVILINTSKPLGENTVWQIPNNVTIANETNDYIVLKFSSVGTYNISLKQTQGDCYALYSKIINVEEKTISNTIGTFTNPFIEDFTVSPNPNQGQFSAVVKLKEESPIKLRLYALTGQHPIIQKHETGFKSYVVNFNLNIATGTYALVLETSKQTLIKKIIIY